MRHFPIALLALISAGCEETRPQPETFERIYPRKVEQVWDAAAWTARVLELWIDAETRDWTGGRMDAREQDGDEATIEVRRVESERTSLSIRVDPENRFLAEDFLRRVGDKLDTGDPAAPIEPSPPPSADGIR